MRSCRPTWMSCSAWSSLCSCSRRPAHHRLDRSVYRAAVHRLCAGRLPCCRRRGPTGLRPRLLIGHLFITLGESSEFQSMSRRPDHPVHHLRTFLQHSGAGKFFIDFSMALMGNKPNSAGRTVVLASFLLGGLRARASPPRSPSAPSPIR